MNKVSILSAALLAIPVGMSAQQPAGTAPVECCQRVEIIANRSGGFEKVPEYMTVWVEPRSAVRAFHPALVSEAREAFRVWSDAGVPVVFDFTADSSRAIVRIFWRHRFRETVTGRSTWWKAAGQLRGVDVEVALGTESGGDAPVVRAVIMHEIGHLLGFSHSKERDSIMSYYVSRAELSSRDIERLRERFARETGQR